MQKIINLKYKCYKIRCSHWNIACDDKNVIWSCFKKKLLVMKYNFGLKVKKQNIRLLDHNAQSCIMYNHAFNSTVKSI